MPSSARKKKLQRPLLGDGVCSFFSLDAATPEIYTLSLHDALPIRHPTDHDCCNDRMTGSQQGTAMRQLASTSTRAARSPTTTRAARPTASGQMGRARPGVEPASAAETTVRTTATAEHPGL